MNALTAWITSTLYVLGQKKNDRGATAVEYGLMVALIAVAIITVVGLLGGQLTAIFEQVRAALAAA